MIPGKQDSKGYCETLEDGLLEFAANTFGETYTFHRDNAPVHTSRYTRKWLYDRNIDVQDWPAKSPGLNIIEKVWGTVARTVYKNGRYFDCFEDLKEYIGNEWANLEVEYPKSLYKSIPKRLMQVLEKEGRNTTY